MGEYFKAYKKVTEISKAYKLECKTVSAVICKNCNLSIWNVVDDVGISIESCH